MTVLPHRDLSPRRRKLDRSRIVQAALELLDESGLDNLTMRGLAGRLKVTAASLYRHVRDKDELLILLADEISGDPPELAGSGNWRRRLTDMAWNQRRVLRRHRDAARLLAMTPPLGERRLRHIEATLGVLRGAGLSARDAAHAAYHLNNFVTEFAADEARLSAVAQAAGTTRRKMFTQAGQYFRRLPAGEFPHVVELAGELSADDPDALFRFGLEIWLDGLEKRRPARRG